jgi:branched-chain amino acid transport system permease protein
MSLFISAVLSGITTGCIYAFVAIGYTVVFKATGIFNLAQGDLVMVGIMSSYFFLDVMHWTFWVTYPLVIIVVVLVSLLEERTVVRFFLNRTGSGAFGWFIATLGFSLVLETVVLTLYGQHATVPIPSAISGGSVHIGQVVVSYQDIFVVALFISVVIGMEAIYRRTWMGQAMRATAEDREAVRLVGVNPVRMSQLGFLLGGIVSGVAGIAIAPLTFSDPTIGLSLALKGFLALALGGFGNLSGAITGGLVLGVAEGLWDLYFGSNYDVLAGIILVLGVLILRPGGLTRTTVVRLV